VLLRLYDETESTTLASEAPSPVDKSQT
jgi:hypothetical protein